MATQPTQPEVNENVIPTDEDILASLRTKADLDGFQEVKAWLWAYNIEDPLKTLKTNFNNFTKDALLKTLMFLHSQYEIALWKNLLQQDMANETIYRIQNLWQLWYVWPQICYKDRKKSYCFNVNSVGKTGTYHAYKNY